MRLLLFNRTNSYELVGKTGVYKGESDKMTFASYLIRLSLFSDYLDVDFVNLVMNSVYFRKYQIEPNLTQQNGQANFNGTKLSLTFIPLPPLTEQKRIVAKVDELMRLCDELERRQAERREARSSLNRAVLDQLLAASDATEFQARWHTISTYFPTLTATPDLIGKLRQTVLQLAVQGKLTRQDPQDEPATSLLRRIRAEKEQILKEHLKRADTLPPIGLNETPFKLPNGWTWVRLRELTEIITKGSSPKWQGINYTDASTGVLFITSENVRNYVLDVSEPKYVEATFNEIEPRSILKRSDILMNIVGASIGRTALYDLNKIANINQAVCLIRLIKPEALISLDYMLHFFNSDTSISLMFDKQVDNARANLSMGNIAKFPIPLPPLEEQKRIVAAVNQLMALCDELEANLRRAEQDAERLLRAAVRSLLASASEISPAEAAALVVQ